MSIKKFFIAFLIFCSVEVYGKNIWIVKDIQFKGLKNFSEKEALKNIVFNIGSKFSEYDVKNSIRSLFETGKYKDIEVTYSGQTIIFNVQEKPIISNIIISGNNIINTSVLNTYLRKLNIVKGSVFSSFLENIFIKTIQDVYYNLGRYKSNIKILKNFSENNTVHLEIIIDEGQSIKINSIKIFGNKDISEDKILSIFKLKNHHSWWNFLDKSLYSPKKLDQDLENLNNFYLNKGYFYFNIDAKRLDLSGNKNYLDIIINISEGKKYRISNFFINGNLFPYEKRITDFVKINYYELYNKDKINYIVNEITRFLSENGYINAKIIVEPKIDHEKKTIVLNFNIDINKRYFVKRINFIGNELTQDKVLRREIKQMEGEYFNIKLVELSKKLLERTKYFSNVKVIKNIHSKESNQVDITYQVQEQPTGSINFGLGYGIDSGISFNTSFSQENILGSGNSLKVSAIKNNNQKYIDLSTNYPYFMSNNIDLNNRFFYNDFKYNFNSISNLIKNTYGFEANLGFLINNTNKVNFGFGYTHNGINNQKKVVKNSSSIKKILDVQLLKNSLVDDFTMNYSWIYDSLEYLYFPISGNKTYISGKNTIPGSDNNFYKLILDSEEYIPLNKGKKFIFLSHINMGIGNSFTKANEFPFYENFNISSMNNIRGFRPNTIGPKKIYNNDLEKCIGFKNKNICESFDSVGGNATLITNLELITPLPFLESKYSQFLRTSLFLDAGNIWDTQSNSTKSADSLKFSDSSILNDIYSSVGLSLQWFSPIGPLVFSYSFPIQTNKNYQLEPFQLHLGKNW
ncbi:outer membrane protein assembly factor BamA [Buchnera aphidicola (Hyperomyzus lactucae)]|uniref:Outer membrane protein assembly factor BamA n=1 Tax=Buchnera aphidicola (Hyperomyzus lactucae) TaxID=1241860 RepID=A0A4D6Y369_9GAMM|nr:outer membrane protein assembly factor BamA [Buchnera aphidicola]QCI20964.1 outer membrane protein assembly factor BamA [Buchnera aphidicola (Hyperomyzus lactucae)]